MNKEIVEIMFFSNEDSLYNFDIVIILLSSILFVEDF